MIKFLGIGCLGLSIALAFAGMHIKTLNAEKELLNSQVIQLGSRIIEQKETNVTLTKLHDAALVREQDLENNLNAIRNERDEFSNEINELRMTEHARALTQPFERGNAAADRLKRIWMRLERPANTNDIPSDTSEAKTVQGSTP